MKVQYTVCDVCQSPTAPTRPYRISSDGRVVNTDRCVKHAEVFEALFKNVDETPVRRRGRQPVKGVTTMEQIEADKAAKRAKEQTS